MSAAVGQEELVEPSGGITESEVLEASSEPIQYVRLGPQAAGVGDGDGVDSPVVDRELDLHVFRRRVLLHPDQRWGGPVAHAGLY